MKNLDNWIDRPELREFERHPILKKEGELLLVFVDNGHIIEAEQTTFKVDSVVFVVDHDGTEVELWLAINHPLLRALKPFYPLVGKTATLRFEGEGLEKKGELVSMSEKPAVGIG